MSFQSMRGGGSGAVRGTGGLGRDPQESGDRKLVSGWVGGGWARVTCLLSL